VTQVAYVTIGAVVVARGVSGGIRRSARLIWRSAVACPAVISRGFGTLHSCPGRKSRKTTAIMTETDPMLP